MQALIDFLVRNLMALWPIARINEWQTGFTVRCGLIHRELTPGLHWRWPFLEEVRRWPATEITVDLPVGAVTTTDGYAAAISANLSYRLVSMRTNWLAVQDSDASLVNVALGVIASECAGRSWPQLCERRRALETDLTGRVNEVAVPWGLLVTRLRLTDLVRARQYRLIGDAPRPGQVTK
jgi:regulator of protease activity HflC (stomatin/prohibitin superfamily)